MGNTPEKGYLLRLFIAGDEVHSRRAQDVLRRLCRRLPEGRYRLEIIDVTQDYRAALEHGVLVAPTLHISPPDPPVVVVGSLDDEQRLRELLGCQEEE